MTTYYTTQRTTVVGIPIQENGRHSLQQLKEIGFKLDYIEDGIFYTKPQTSFWDMWTAFASDSEAIEHYSEAWEKHKRVYERDRWTAHQEEDSMDITFISPEGVLNIYTNWVIKKAQQ